MSRTNEKSRLSFRHDLWALLKPYWTSEERLRAGLLLFAIVALTLAGVYMDVLFNHWYNAFYNSLQEKNKAEFFRLMGRFCVLATIYIIVGVYATYLGQMLQVRWRRWLTDRYLKEWLSDRAYYRLQLAGNPTDNPDQRITEDLSLLVDQTLNLGLGLVNAVVTLIAFVGILWGLSGTLELPFNGQTYVMYGYMVWVAVGYAVIGSWLTQRIGHPLIRLNFQQQRYEADLRFSLVRFRENSEGVALYRGEDDELQGFRARFAHVFANWWAIMRRQKLLNFYTSGYTQLAVVFPFLVAAPRFFSGAIQLGGLMQIGNAFGNVQRSLSWFVQVYSGSSPNTGLAGWKATVDRLTTFHNALLAVRAEPHAAGPLHEHGSSERLELQHVGLQLPDGRSLVSDANLVVDKGAHILIQGPTGSGKSTLFRAIAGIWPFGSGKVLQPSRFAALFLPQRPYFPLGTLRQAIAYPAPAPAFSDEQLAEALTAVGLGELASRLDETANWAMHLSGGEQQRVAFARALLHQPEWLFLDEATSQVDSESQRALYELLLRRLPHSTIVSVAHRDELAQFHRSRVELRPMQAGARLIGPVAQPGVAMAPSAA